MFNKILIANRGEIACRIIKTCQKLNIKTVAVYSEADADAPFVTEADEAYLLGGPKVNESYLNIDKIIEIAKQTKVEAIHPGYGLLSENTDFAKHIEDAGMTFIGPSSDAINRMGSKLTARRTMENANVPIIPGTNDPIESVEKAKSIAAQIGYPVMVKAAHGGGGIGMQIVHEEQSLEKAFESNARRAEQFFGNGTMFIEKVIEDAHHIEIQVLADQHGHTIHLNERECSIQRRHQKIIEEAPSPLINAETREQMGQAAIRAAQSIEYVNAGTIEFLVDENENFYFLEMNTRLQVEHPITEMITGIDLVEQQLNIAYGKPLHIQQSEVQINGHAIEARIYAEDPNTFFPSPGQLTAFEPPEGDGIRNDIGVHGQYQVTPYYDPMLAKLIVYGETRQQAIKTLSYALDQYTVSGIKTNIPFLIDVAKSRAFERGETRTSFINEFMVKQ